MARHTERRGRRARGRHRTVHGTRPIGPHPRRRQRPQGVGRLHFRRDVRLRTAVTVADGGLGGEGHGGDGDGGAGAGAGGEGDPGAGSGSGVSDAAEETASAAEARGGAAASEGLGGGPALAGARVERDALLGGGGPGGGGRGALAGRGVGGRGDALRLGDVKDEALEGVGKPIRLWNVKRYVSRYKDISMTR